MGATVFFEGSNELATLTNTFKVSGVATDPTAISLAVTDPLGVTTTYTYAGGTITKSSTGVYTKDIACATPGTWSYVWTGTGTASDVTSGTWEVFETSLGKLYAPMDVLKSRLGMALTDTADDSEIHFACFTASRTIENECERTFWRTATETVRYFAANTAWLIRLGPFNDLVSTSAIASDNALDGLYATSWLATDYQLRPINTSGSETRPYTEIHSLTNRFPLAYAAWHRTELIKVTGVFGWPRVPYPIKMATLMLAEEIFKGKDAAFGVAGFGEFGAVRVRENPKIQSLINHYRLDAVKVA